MKINFEEITPEDFEYLCEDLLITQGLSIISRPSRGPDSGKDIIAKRIIKDSLKFSEEEVFLVECKHHAKSGKSVSPMELGEVYLKMRMHSANRYLLITSSSVSETVKNLLKTITEDPSNPYKAAFWIKSDLVGFLNNNPNLISKYFFNWEREAQEAAKYCHEHLFQVHRGTILWSPNVTAIFGNDGYGPIRISKSKNSDLRPRQEVEALRQKLSSMNIEELSFTVYERYTWVLLAKTKKVRELNNFIWGAFPAEESYLRTQKKAADQVLWHFFDKPFKQLDEIYEKL